MIDFSVVKSITIPEGVVTKIEYNGGILWQIKNKVVNMLSTSIDANGNIFNGTGYKVGYKHPADTKLC